MICLPIGCRYVSVCEHASVFATVADCQCCSYIISSCFQLIFWFSVLVCIWKKTMHEKSGDGHSCDSLANKVCEENSKCNLCEWNSLLNDHWNRLNFFNCHKLCCCAIFWLLSTLICFEFVAQTAHSSDHHYELLRCRLFSPFSFIHQLLNGNFGVELFNNPLNTVWFYLLALCAQPASQAWDFNMSSATIQHTIKSMGLFFIFYLIFHQQTHFFIWQINLSLRKKGKIN